MNKQDFDGIESSFFKRGNPLKKLLRLSLNILGARQTGILYGTNQTGLKFLPTTMWDRGMIDKFDGRGFKGLILKLFGKMIVSVKKLSPIYFFKKGTDNDKEDNDGIISYILRNCADYYNNGISVFIFPEIQMYIRKTDERYVYVPIYNYDGTQIRLSDEKIKVDTEIVRHFDALNFLSIYLPDYGILTINTADTSLMAMQDGLFVMESDLTDRLDSLIRMVEAASLASLGLIKGKTSAELLWRKEIHLRQASTELIHNEKKFRNLYENAPVAYLSVDREGIIQRSNNQAQELLGYAKSELTGRDAASLIYDIKDVSLLLEHIKNSPKKNNHITNLELQLLPKNQTPVWINLSIDTVLDSSDNIQEFRVAAHDITDKRRAEEKVKKTREELEIRVEQRTADLLKEVEERAMAEEKYRILMDASPVPITVYNIDGKTVYVNPAFTQTFGWTLDELQGEKIDYVPSEELPSTHRMIELLKKGGHYSGFETRRYNKKGEILDVSISFDVWMGNDRVPKGSVVILHDITERKRLEMQLVQSRKMEAMGTLAGGIAHDFNNILSGIFSYSQLAEKHIENPQKAKEHISQILKGAKRAADLVQQILTFSRQTEYQKKPLHLSSVVTDILTLMRSTIPTSIEIQEDLDSEAMVLADSTQIHQVIINLCTNAYHAMHENGGILTIKIKEMHISEGERVYNLDLVPGHYLKLSIRDTGHGMSPETLEKIFDLYFTTKEVGKGTGFGLALVHAIVEEHDGYIYAESTPGEGSGFYIFFPVIQENAEISLPEQREERVMLGTEHIMIVDDEESIRFSTQEYLIDMGYRVSCFENGLQALQEFEKKPDGYDLIITDMNMPKMTGDELSVRMLELRDDLPIMLCTGYSELITEAKALELGICRYIQKPILGQDLLSLIRDELDRKKSKK